MPVTWNRFLSRQGDGFQITYSRIVEQSIIDQILTDRAVLSKLSAQHAKRPTRTITLVQKDFTKAAGMVDGYYGCAKLGRFQVHGGQDIRNIERQAWNALHMTGYTSFDIKSCVPTAICHLFEAPLLREWVENRESLVPEGATMDQMKQAVNAIVTCPNTTKMGFDSEELIPDAIADYGFIRQLRVEMFDVHDQLREQYPGFCKLIKVSDLKKRGGSTIMSYVGMDVESVAIAAMASVLPAGAPMDIKHDQVDVKLPAATDINEVVGQMEDVVLAATGIPFKIKATPVTTTLMIDLDAAANEYVGWKRVFEQRYFCCINSRSVMRIDEETGNPTPVNQAELFFLEKHNARKLKQWLSDPQRLTYQAVRFLPPPLVVPDNVYNTWDTQEFAAELLPPLGPDDDRDIILAPFMEYFNYVTGGEMQCKEYLLNYMAHIIQKPGDKVDTFVASLGTQGSGRNSLFEDIFMTHVIGNSLCYMAKNLGELFMNFNAESENKLVIVVQESYRSDFTKHYDNLKAFTGSKKTTVNRKNEKIYTNTNYARVFVITNDMNTLNLPHDDRRNGCALGSIKPPLTAKGTEERYFTWLHREVVNNPKVIRAFYELLRDRDIDGFRAGNTIQDSAILRTARAFNAKTMDNGTIAAFLHCYLPFAKTTYNKRDKADNLTESEVVKTPLAAALGAWQAFLRAFIPQGVAEKLDFKTEINKLMNRTARIDPESGMRLESIEVDATPKTRLFGRHGSVRAIKFEINYVQPVISSILKDVDVYEMEKGAPAIFSDELQTYLSGMRG